jgi:hypothetical protein
LAPETCTRRPFLLGVPPLTGSGACSLELTLNWLSMGRNILLEFGPAEVLDSTIVRPLAMGLATSYLGRERGVPLGKIISDLIFYVVAALALERRRRHLIDPTDTVSVEPQ